MSERLSELPSRPPQVDVGALIDRNPIGAYQVGMLLMCGLCLIMDGFDVQAMGYVAPALLAEWDIPRAALGPVFGAGLFGMLIGSLVLSVVADRLGRRPVLWSPRDRLDQCRPCNASTRSRSKLLPASC
jgi:hypothetical protein